MICDECKECYNFQVCENGCFGSVQPCEFLETDKQHLKDKLEDMNNI